jgi:hypothetical protein
MVVLAALGAASCVRTRSAGLPGTLDKPIDQYSGAELRDLAQTLHWTGGHERQRLCAGDSSCDTTPPGKTTLVKIDAVAGQDSLVIRRLPEDGVIAAQLTNRGALEERRYHMKPGGRYTYYLIVYGGDSTGTWRLEELDHAGTGYSHREIARGTFSGCGHPFVRGAQADFKSCATAHPSGELHLMMQGGDPTLSDPIWITCASGCCIASQS